MLRAPWGPLSAVIVIVALAMSTVLVAPQDVGASSGHVRRHMPSLVGLTRSQVFAVMRRDALYFVTKGPGSSTENWREVVAQSPKAGTIVPWHFEASVTTSLANPHRPRRVPRLIGLTRLRTFAVMKRAQLYLMARGPGSSDGKWVVVLHQSPPAGTRVRWHAVVSVTVSTVRPRHKKPVHKPVTTTTVKKPPKKTKTCSPTTPTSTTSPTTSTTTLSPTSTTSPGETSTIPVATTTVAPRPTTTTTICKVVTTTTVKPRKKTVRYRIGDATWYAYIPGRCATWYLPRGTRITVRDLQTGKVVHCLATDREGAHGNRAVDLDEAQFAQLAPLSRGVVVVRVSW